MRSHRLEYEDVSNFDQLISYVRNIISPQEQILEIFYVDSYKESLYIKNDQDFNNFRNDYFKPRIFVSTNLSSPSYQSTIVTDTGPVNTSFEKGAIFSTIRGPSPNAPPMHHHKLPPNCLTLAEEPKSMIHSSNPPNGYHPKYSSPNIKKSKDFNITYHLQAIDPRINKKDDSLDNI